MGLCGARMDERSSNEPILNPRDGGTSNDKAGCQVLTKASVKASTPDNCLNAIHKRPLDQARNKTLLCQYLQAYIPAVQKPYPQVEGWDHRCSGHKRTGN